MRYYHMIIERNGGWDIAPEGRREYISPHAGLAPYGWKCVAVCGYHEKPREVQFPCRNCVYFDDCGHHNRTEQCDRRKTRSQVQSGV